MNIVSKERFIYLFILMVFSYFLFPSSGFCLSSLIEEDTVEASLLEQEGSSVLLAKAKKKKKSKKSKKKKKKENKQEAKETKDTKSINSYWGVGGGFLVRNAGIIYADLRKDLFSNFFLYLQGRYTLGCSQYFDLYGGGLGVLYSFRVSNLVEIAGGADFSVSLLSVNDQNMTGRIFKNSSSTDVASTTFMYVQPRLSVALHFTSIVAVTLEAGASVNVVAGEEVSDDVAGYTGTGFHFGGGAMLTF